MKKNIKVLKIWDLKDESVYKTNTAKQRPYIYELSDAEYLLDTILKGMPVPALFFWDNGDNTYDIVDGKQRLTTIQYFLTMKPLGTAGFTFKGILTAPGNRNYSDLSDKEQENIFDTEIPCVICTGTELERQETFLRLNLTAKPLTDWEVVFATHPNKFMNECQEWCNAHSKLFGVQDRGRKAYELLKILFPTATTVKEMSNDVGLVSEKSFLELYSDHLNNLIDSIKDIFDDLYDNWASRDAKSILKIFYQNFGKVKDIIKNKVDIYEKYKILVDNGSRKNADNIEKFYYDLFESIGFKVDPQRYFTEGQKYAFFHSLHPNKIGRVICNGCKKEFTYVDLEMDHIKPWSKGGKTELENAQLLCKHCNTSKGNK